MSKTELSAMKIVTLVKEEALTTGGGFLLEKGVGTLAGHGVGGSLSNRRAQVVLSPPESKLCKWKMFIISYQPIINSRSED
jgi:hypothetical protein